MPLSLAQATLGGGILSAFGQTSANKQNARLAQKQMDFQERMRDTAHQAEIKDLKAAGLNPILSGLGGSGAASPGGATAKMENIGEKAVSSALGVQQLSNIKKTGELIGAQVNETNAKTVLTKNESVKSGVQADMWSELQRAMGIAQDLPNSARQLHREYTQRKLNEKEYARLFPKKKVTKSNAKTYPYPDPDLKEPKKLKSGQYAPGVLNRYGDALERQITRNRNTKGWKKTPGKYKRKPVWGYTS